MIDDFETLDPLPLEIQELNRIGKMVPEEVKRQRREYSERILFVERVFGPALRQIEEMEKK